MLELGIDHHIKTLVRIIQSFRELPCVGWVHVVVGDNFMAHRAHLDALERGMSNWAMALVAGLIAFLGPAGMIVHLIIRSRSKRAGPAGV